MRPEGLAEPQLNVSPEIPLRGLRAIFSFPTALGAVLVVLMVLTIRSRFSDPDMWWHLKTGQIIWNTHTIPRVDLFSFTTNGHAWTAQEWLTQLTIYGAYSLGGYTGLMLWFCATASLVVLAAYVLCAVYSHNVKVAFLGGLITWLFSTVGLAIRPHLVGYLLLISELLILHLGRTRDSRWFLALPPLFALWVNCHAGFFFGLIVFATALACSYVDIRAGLLVSHRMDERSRYLLLAAFVFSIAALFLNPIGPRQVIYPVDVMWTQQVQMHNVSEWQPPHFDNARALVLLATAGLILLLPLLRQVELRLYELLLFTLAFGLAMQHERLIFVFGIVTAPILCRLLATAWDQYEPDRDRPAANGLLLAASLSIMIWAFPNRHQLDLQVQKSNPVKAVDFINRSGLAGKMLNEYVYGGYLIWAAPQQRVFVDGRGDVFEWTGVLTEYGKWMTLQADPKVVLDKYHIDFCLLSHEAPMSRVLPFMPGWTMIYSDEQAAIFARSIPPNLHA
jgi:hypothetical protein